MLNVKSIKYSIIPVMVLAMTALLSGCKTEPVLTDFQKRQMTTKTFDGSYDNIFAATQTVIQDRQYVIKTATKDSGLITAEKTKDDSDTGMTFMGMAMHENRGDSVNNVQTEVQEVSASVSQVSKKSSEVRLSLQDKGMNKQGGVVSSKQLYKPEVFQDIFNAIRVEIQRRQAIGRS